MRAIISIVLLALYSIGQALPNPKFAEGLIFGSAQAPRSFSQLHSRPVKNNNRKLRLLKREMESTQPSSTQVNFQYRPKKKPLRQENHPQEDYFELSREMEQLQKLEQDKLTLAQINALISNSDSNLATIRHAANRARRSVFSRSSPDFHSEVISAITAYRKSSTTMTAYFTIGRSLHGNQNDRDDFQNLIAMSETTNGLIEIDISDILRLIPSLQSQLSPILDDIKIATDQISSTEISIEKPRSRLNYYFV